MFILLSGKPPFYGRANTKIFKMILRSQRHLEKHFETAVWSKVSAEAKDLIRMAGNKLNLVVERGDMIVPSMNTAFPKPKAEDETDNKPKSYSQMV